jgi:muramoyltetrapeptide carboxypeptidase
MEPLKPARIRKGDVVGVLAPASPIGDPARIEQGVRYLEGLGYRVQVGESVRKEHGYLAGTDEERLDDLHRMVKDRSVRMIIALRGGYGTPRLLARLRPRLFARDPKILVGFSDLTGLQLALWESCRLVTFHGPMLGVDFAGVIDPYTEEMFWALVTSRRAFGELRMPDQALPPVALRRGEATGRLAGGNLSLVCSLMGTPFIPSFRKAVVFLEEVGEEPYRLDRMLTQLRLAGVFRRARAVVTGQFSDCVPRDPSRPSLSVDQILAETAGEAGLPFVAGMQFGHVTKKLTIPTGVKCRVDAAKASVRLLEGAVR